MPQTRTAGASGKTSAATEGALLARRHRVLLRRSGAFTHQNHPQKDNTGELTPPDFKTSLQSYSNRNRVVLAWGQTVRPTEPSPEASLVSAHHHSPAAAGLSSSTTLRQFPLHSEASQLHGHVYQLFPRFLPHIGHHTGLTGSLYCIVGPC